MWEREDEMGSGNPHNPDGVITDYLWLDVLTKDSISTESLSFFLISIKKEDSIFLISAKSSYVS